MMGSSRAVRVTLVSAAMMLLASFAPAETELSEKQKKDPTYYGPEKNVESVEKPTVREGLAKLAAYGTFAEPAAPTGKE